MGNLSIKKKDKDIDIYKKNDIESMNDMHDMHDIIGDKLYYDIVKDIFDNNCLELKDKIKSILLNKDKQCKELKEKFDKDVRQLLDKYNKDIEYINEETKHKISILKDTVILDKGKFYRYKKFLLLPPPSSKKIPLGKR